MQRRLITLLATASVVAVVLSVGSTPAAAEEPLRFEGADQVVDPYGLLADRADDVERAARALRDDHGLQLFVIVVERLDGRGAQDWAERTATLNGLGLDDVLLVIATEDRQYALSVDDTSSITDDELRVIAAERVEPLLRQGDWAGAALAAVDGLAEGSRPAGGTSWTWVAFWVLVTVVALGALATWLVSRRTRTPTDPVDPLDTLPLDELSTLANSRLVELDDALATSRFDLQIATREFGDDATAAFARALADATQLIADGWRATATATEAPEDERRRLLRHVLDDCAGADTLLDSQTERFEQLRDRVGRVEELLDTVEARAELAEGQLPDMERRWNTLMQRYPDSALEGLADHVEQAGRSVGFARRNVRDGRSMVAAGDRHAAALGTSAAEEALASAELLLQGLGTAETSLSEADAALDATEQEVRTDLVAAESHLMDPAQDPELSAAARTARAVLGELSRHRSAGTVDPIRWVAQLTEAGGELDARLAAHREAHERRERAAAMVHSSLGTVRARIEGLRDFVTTRRGAIGAEARSALAEATRSVDEATSCVGTDPERALELVRTAQHQVERAERAARSDVDGYRQHPWGGSGGGDLATMVLGGILLDSVLRGPRGGGYGGGRSGGGWSGGGNGGRGGGLGPGSFGGSASRRSTGGRF